MEEQHAVQHIAFIMDGNGRWAQQRGLPREAGHQAGAQNLKRMLLACAKRNIHVMTVYAFSQENWKRPDNEVAAIMKLLAAYIEEGEKIIHENHLCIRVLGDVSRLSPNAQKRIQKLEADSLPYEKEHLLQVAFNYGGRQEIVHAVNTLLEQGKTGPFTEEDIESALYTRGVEDPDLIVRTSGEMRTSNFLLWQSAYAEYAITKTYWPDFGEEELDAILQDFATRHRRYGGL